MPSLAPDTRRRFVLLGTVVALFVALLGAVNLYQRYLRTQATPPLTGQLNLASRPPGQYRLLYDARTTTGQTLHTASAFTLNDPPPSPSPSPVILLSPTPVASLSPAPTPTTSPISAEPVIGEFENYVSAAPVNLLATWEGFGPSHANLTLQGTAQTNPPFTVQATATYENNQWSMSGVSHSALPPGSAAPQFLSDTSSLNGYGRDFVAVRSGGSDAYRMNWVVSGTASDNIGIVLLPRMQSSPWRGQKAGIVIKGRHTAAAPADNAPYGPNNSNLHGMVDAIAAAIRAMSNNQTQLSYRVEESTFALPEQCSLNVITDQLVRNLGITDRPSNYQWLIPTLYTQTFTAFNNTLCEVPQGLSPNFHGYPLSGPGAWEPNILWPNEALNRPTALHEFGHGIGLTHPHVNALCPGASHDEVRIKDLFESCGNSARTPDSNMGGQTTFWWHPIDRAVLSWLTGKQVTLVTESGTYDVYSDNDDLTSDPTKPLILQILVTVNGQSDFVYVTVPNPANIAAMPNVTAEHREHYVSGVQLSAGSPLRGGVSNAALSITTYTFTTEQSITDQVYKNVIPAGETIRLRWPGTDVTINVLSRSSHQARVQVTYN